MSNGINKKKLQVIVKTNLLKIIVLLGCNIGKWMPILMQMPIESYFYSIIVL